MSVDNYISVFHRQISHFLIQMTLSYTVLAALWILISISRSLTETFSETSKQASKQTRRESQKTSF